MREMASHILGVDVNGIGTFFQGNLRIEAIVFNNNRMTIDTQCNRSKIADRAGNMGAKHCQSRILLRFEKGDLWSSQIASNIDCRVNNPPRIVLGLN